MPEPIDIPLPTSSESLSDVAINEPSNALDEAEIEVLSSGPRRTAPASLLGYRPRSLQQDEQYPQSYFKTEIEKAASELEIQLEDLGRLTREERRGIFET